MEYESEHFSFPVVSSVRRDKQENENLVIDFLSSRSNPCSFTLGVPMCIYDYFKHINAQYM